MTAYYNEIDPYAAQWLRNLMAAGHIAKGEVDERSITEIQPDDLRGFDQCHFFAGIGVWSHALRRAGWPDDRPVWTGSCPCQPFSTAGQQRGFNDERHLWPVWYHLIDQCRPPVVLGEQVASALDWLDLVSADMEASDYAFGASDLCAAGFGGAHIRQRLYFAGVAGTQSSGWGEKQPHAGRRSCGVGSRETLGRFGVCRDGSMADADADDARSQGYGRSRNVDVPQGWQVAGRYGAENGVAGGLGNARHEPSERHAGGVSGTETQVDGARIAKHGIVPVGPANAGDSLGGPTGHAPLLGRDAADWLYCRDGKWRPVEPGTFPLADAAPARVGRLRAYGNGLDAETATQFIAAVMGCAP